jgi:hypothetical protein
MLHALWYVKRYAKSLAGGLRQATSEVALSGFDSLTIDKAFFGCDDDLVLVSSVSSERGVVG